MNIQGLTYPRCMMTYCLRKFPAKYVPSKASHQHIMFNTALFESYTTLRHWFLRQL